MPTLYTIGYEKLLPEQLAAELEVAGVKRVLDVRIRPQSRRPGMSKTRLGDLLAQHAIAYEARQDLGTPHDIRDLFRAGRLEQARPAYRAHLEGQRAREVDALAEELETAPPTALLCLEEDPRHCHRDVIAQALRERLPDLRVIDL